MTAGAYPCDMYYLYAIEKGQYWLIKCTTGQMYFMWASEEDNLELVSTILREEI